MRITDKRRAANAHLAALRSPAQAPASQAKRPRDQRRQERLLAERARDAEWGQLEAPHNVRYQPLDETLSTFRIRILRAMRWLDWASQPELVVAGDFGDERSARTALAVELYRLTTMGLLEKRQPWRRQGSGGGPSRSCAYRITAAGREYLAKRLEVRMDVCDDDEAALEEGAAA